MAHNFKIFRFNSVHSTNATAKKGYAESAFTNGSVILADTQLAGRGQMRTKWHDAPGENLLLTLVVEPEKLTPLQFFRINEAVSLAISDVLPKDCNPKIKWPNDVYLNGKKIAGILVETVIQGAFIKTAFIGIGLNVNQKAFDADFVATSLALETTHLVDRQILLAKLLEQLQLRLGQMHFPALLDRTYLNRLMGVNSPLVYRDSKGIFNAKIKRVEDDGRLVLAVQGETDLRYYRFKEVKLLSR